MPRMRMTVMGLMVLVAIAATALWILRAVMRASRQAEFYRTQADRHFLSEQDHRNRATSFYSQMMNADAALDLRREKAQDERDKRYVRRDERMIEYFKEVVNFEDRVADHHRSLVFKYGHAADYPWEPVAPDPPVPGPPPEQPSSIP